MKESTEKEEEREREKEEREREREKFLVFNYITEFLGSYYIWQKILSNNNFFLL